MCTELESRFYQRNRIAMIMDGVFWATLSQLQISRRAIAASQVEPQHSIFTVPTAIYRRGLSVPLQHGPPNYVGISLAPTVTTSNDGQSLSYCVWHSFSSIRWRHQWYNVQGQQMIFDAGQATHQKQRDCYQIISGSIWRTQYMTRSVNWWHCLPSWSSCHSLKFPCYQYGCSLSHVSIPSG